MTGRQNTQLTQNAHLTYKGNRSVGRHGWLRLTPAYSVRLVRDHLAALPPGSVITDPFSGTGTTALAAAELGLRGQALDINPFLIWLGEAKTRFYDATTIATATRDTGVVASPPARLDGEWRPRLANIERWWPAPVLGALGRLRAGLDQLPPGPARDLLELGFCRTLIETSNAAFNHQSMSFRPPGAAADERQVLDLFRIRAAEVVASAGENLPGSATVVRADSREMDTPALQPCDLLFTSPPYVNRMSYVRELRPYMYWLRYLDTPADAADLDWAAVGGTWGTATSRLATWQSTEDLPLERELSTVCQRIATLGGRSGGLLATYVRKYFTDVWSHVQAAYKHVKSGGRATYIVGNSTFYGHIVPAEQWYQRLLLEAGFTGVDVGIIRKRNSKQELFEFAITAHRP